MSMVQLLLDESPANAFKEFFELLRPGGSSADVGPEACEDALAEAEVVSLPSTSIPVTRWSWLLVAFGGHWG